MTLLARYWITTDCHLTESTLPSFEALVMAQCSHLLSLQQNHSTQSIRVGWIDLGDRTTADTAQAQLLLQTRFKALFEALPATMTAATLLGNHDLDYISYRALSDFWGQYQSNQVLSHPHANLILFSPEIQKAPDGWALRQEAAELAWLQSALTKQPGTKLVFSHLPLYRPDIEKPADISDEQWCYGMFNRDTSQELQALFAANHPQLSCHGHWHHERSMTQAGMTHLSLAKTRDSHHGYWLDIQEDNFVIYPVSAISSQPAFSLKP